MKKIRPAVFAVYFFVGISVAILLGLAAHLELRSRYSVQDHLWSSYTNFRLLYLTPPQTFSARIGSISPTMESLRLTRSPVDGAPIAIDPSLKGDFWDGAIKVGDWVSVTVRKRVSPSRKYELYLEGICVDVAGLPHLPKIKAPSDFSDPIRLSITPDPRNPGLELAVGAKITSGNNE